MPLDLRLITLLESQGGFGDPGPPPPVFGSSVQFAKAFTSVSGFTASFPKTIPAGDDRILVVPAGFDYANSSESGTLPHTHIEGMTFDALALKRLGRSDRHALAEALLLLEGFESPYVAGNIIGQESWTDFGDSTSGTGKMFIDITGHIDAQTVAVQCPSLGQLTIQKLYGFTSGGDWEVNYDLKLIKFGSNLQSFRIVLAGPPGSAATIFMTPGNDPAESLSTFGRLSVQGATFSLAANLTLNTRHRVRLRQRGTTLKLYLDDVLVDTVGALLGGGRPINKSQLQARKTAGGSFTLGDNFAFDNYAINDVSVINAFSGGWPGRVELWYLLNPPVTTANVVVTVRSFGGATTVAPLIVAAWDITKAHQTITWGPFLGETRRDDEVTPTPNAFVNIACNPGELVIATCLGRKNFDMDVDPSQNEQFETTQTDPIDNRDIILAGSTQSGAPCNPTSWTNIGDDFLDRWCIGGAGLVGLETLRVAPVVQFQENFESLIVGNELNGQGGWGKLIVVGPDVDRWIIDGSGIIDGSKSMILKSGSGTFVHFHSVPLMTASTDRRKWTFEFQMNHAAISGFTMSWKKNVPTVATQFDDVALYLEIINEQAFRRVRLDFSDNASLFVSTGIIGSFGIPHTLSLEFFPPDQVRIELNGIPVCTFTTTPGENDFDHVLIETTSVAAPQDGSLILDSFLDEKLA